MYTVDRKDGDLAGAIRRLVAGEEHPADLHAEYVQAFANAVSNLGNRKVKGNPWLPPIHVLFETRDELVQYCKDHVVKLVVRREDSRRDAPGHGRSAETPQGTGRIFNLPTAFAPWPGSVVEGVVDGIVGAESNLWVIDPLERLLAAELDDEASDIRRLSNLPIRRAFVYADISDFSEFQPGQQALMVPALAGIVRRRFLRGVTRPEPAWPGRCGGFVRGTRTALTCRQRGG